jgi:phage shock protein PspC (stress-responsive transcriptional regulator)/predicted membrane protein
MSEHTLHTPITQRLERSQNDRWIAGVAGGLARYFDINPAVFRLGFVVLSLLGGAGILVYIAALLVLPKEGEDASIAEDVLKRRRDQPGRLIALGLIAVAILSTLARADSWPSAGTAWLLILIGGLVLLWTSRRRGIVVALATFLALILVAVISAVAIAFSWFDVSLGDGVGNQSYAPTRVAALTDGYHVGIGKVSLDLTKLPDGQPASVDAKVGIGELRITVPQDAAVTVNAHVNAGSIDAFGHHHAGTNVKYVAGNGKTLAVDAHVGAGQIVVVRAP